MAPFFVHGICWAHGVKLSSAGVHASRVPENLFKYIVSDVSIKALHAQYLVRLRRQNLRRGSNLFRARNPWMGLVHDLQQRFVASYPPVEGGGKVFIQVTAAGRCGAVGLAPALPNSSSSWYSGQVSALGRRAKLNSALLPSIAFSRAFAATFSLVLAHQQVGGQGHVHYGEPFAVGGIPVEVSAAVLWLNAWIIRSVSFAASLAAATP
eukprot:CAMPEP_0172643728 /NCGR_PEP_ID=MMETSP1068-20121228/238159_1 /TAXON_ID=35684 /ORGANISM="Pseudopedinella elastica, Strain CCMP716" /LENGTH=208 /DNA_ID=CAMNT_0013457845 /DNA_START=296 /DNA_END=919 /DNA_ORIENTATION=-